jgi:hypothetical protein
LHVLCCPTLSPQEKGREWMRRNTTQETRWACGRRTKLFDNCTTSRHSRSSQCRAGGAPIGLGRVGLTFCVGRRARWVGACPRCTAIVRMYDRSPSSIATRLGHVLIGMWDDCDEPGGYIAWIAVEPTCRNLRTRVPCARAVASDRDRRFGVWRRGNASCVGGMRAEGSGVGPAPAARYKTVAAPRCRTLGRQGGQGLGCHLREKQGVAWRGAPQRARGTPWTGTKRSAWPGRPGAAHHATA